MGSEEQITMTRSELDRIVEEAIEKGTTRMLKELGLNDADANGDIRELRALLGAWREARKSAIQAVVKLLTTAILGALLLGIGVKLGAGGLFK